MEKADSDRGGGPFSPVYIIEEHYIYIYIYNVICIAYQRYLCKQKRVCAIRCTLYIYLYINT